ncbi:hypothetical protein SAMN05192583_0050 [Sphingomonas gellani]|uniref:Uncharacterized protein n=1 Tax=Sphingomonas gellani TaxID=1166340 RepID=A0A1H7Y1Z5_9SPHN|nr:hypothetical protein [Sphingomonas gellani]SEM39981.1 hypothetical protein SAMN05192583_0050 [Sphingomonas gellani]
MDHATDLHNVLTEDEQRLVLRDTVIHFLSLDPHHPLASFFGQALADLD